MITNETVRQPIDDVIYLASCAVREIAPDQERVHKMNLDQVCHEAERQLLAGCCALSLEAIDVCTEDFEQAKAIAIRKVILMDVQRHEVLDGLEKAGIWYLPLKGSVLKDYYPSIGMREMSDNDILFDATRVEDMRAIMTKLGFREDEFCEDLHYCFYKEPIYNFEMHHVLFDGELADSLNPYYENITDRLLHDEGKQFGYHFSPEDFYLYMVAHEYKHYRGSGIGPRACLDTYVYLSQVTLDMDYVRQEADKMGIAEFERFNRELSFHLINDEQLSDEELDALEYMHKSGIYGNLEAQVEHRVAEKGGGIRGRLSYVLGRAFLPMEKIKEVYPFFYQHKMLLPLLPLVRIGKALTISRQKVVNEIKALRKV